MNCVLMAERSKANLQKMIAHISSIQNPKLLTKHKYRLSLLCRSGFLRVNETRNATPAPTREKTFLNIIFVDVLHIFIDRF